MLALHWDGAAWTVKAIADPSAFDDELFGVDMLSATDGWAVGRSGSSHAALIERWDGAAWHKVPAPAIGSSPYVIASDVAVHSATDASAVGNFERSGPSNRAKMLILHWDGVSWSVDPVPNLGVQSYLGGVAYTSDGTAYAVGTWIDAVGEQHPIFLRRTAAGWTQMPISAGAKTRYLTSLAAVSPTNVIGVGVRARGDSFGTFAVHCTP
jgi:hypothetical protein